MRLAAAMLLSALCSAPAAAEPQTQDGARSAWKCAAADAMPPASTNFNLAGGVIWKKFRKVRERYVLGRPAEGGALSIFRACLKSRNPELASEARAILDAIEATRDLLGERLEEARLAGRVGADEWIKLYLKSYPSQRARFAALRAKKKESVPENGIRPR